VTGCFSHYTVNNIIRNIVSQDWNFTDCINGKDLYNLHPYPAKSGEIRKYQNNKPRGGGGVC
jgi:hypothetical protein